MVSYKKMGCHSLPETGSGEKQYEIIRLAMLKRLIIVTEFHSVILLGKGIAVFSI